MYVVGGLYGNPYALDSILHMASLESAPVTLIFNGDFNFFNVSRSCFSRVNDVILDPSSRASSAIIPLQGNVEVEISASSSGVGCGCAYPSYVAPSVSSRSDAIVKALRETSLTHFPVYHRELAKLPKCLNVDLQGGERLTVVHGDLSSLSGWSFAAEVLSPPDVELRLALGLEKTAVVTTAVGDDDDDSDSDGALRTDGSLRATFERAGRPKAVACTHTCLAFSQAFLFPCVVPPPSRVGVVSSLTDVGTTETTKTNTKTKTTLLLNNGSAGMSNFFGDSRGVVTRVAPAALVRRGSDGTRPRDDDSRGGGRGGTKTLYGRVEGGIAYDAVAVAFDDDKWRREFKQMWPEGSPAHTSYWGRIKGGVAFWDVKRAARNGFMVFE